MTSRKGAGWHVPAALIALSFVPLVAGVLRVTQLAIGGEITPDNARFFASPLPLVLHVFSSAVYCAFGALQFASDFRMRRPGWHRAVGRSLVPCGLVAALSGLWMNQFYPPADFAGPALYVIRLLVGSLMTLFLCLGLVAIRRRDTSSHRAWMMRAYALGLGAGTQFFLHIPWLLFPAIHGELTKTVLMGAGWAINLAVAERIIFLKQRRQVPSQGA